MDPESAITGSPLLRHDRLAALYLLNVDAATALAHLPPRPVVLPPGATLPAVYLESIAPHEPHRQNKQLFGEPAQKPDRYTNSGWVVILPIGQCGSTLAPIDHPQIRVRYGQVVSVHHKVRRVPVAWCRSALIHVREKLLTSRRFMVVVPDFALPRVRSPPFARRHHGAGRSREPPADRRVRGEDEGETHGRVSLLRAGQIGRAGLRAMPGATR